MKPSVIDPTPNPKTGRVEYSVYRADGATDQELWRICADHVEPFTKKPAKARATCTAGVYAKEELLFDPDGKPHPRHANVIGWPEGMRKDELKSIQLRVSAEMELMLREEAK